MRVRATRRGRLRAGALLLGLIFAALLVSGTQALAQSGDSLPGVYEGGGSGTQDPSQQETTGPTGGGSDTGGADQEIQSGPSFTDRLFNDKTSTADLYTRYDSGDYYLVYVDTAESGLLDKLRDFFDSDSNLMDVAYAFLNASFNFLASIIFLIHVKLMYATVWALDYVLSANLLDSMKEAVTKVIGALGDAFLGSSSSASTFLKLMYLAAIGYGGWKILIENKTAFGWSQIAKAAFIGFLAIWLASNPGKFIDTYNYWTEGLSNYAFEAAYASNPSEADPNGYYDPGEGGNSRPATHQEAGRQAFLDTVWESYVLDPYGWLQVSTDDKVAEGNRETLLAMDTQSEREDALQKIADSGGPEAVATIDQSRSFEHLTGACVMAVLGLIFIGLSLFMSLVIFVSQMLVMLIFALSPLILLAAVFPASGMTAKTFGYILSVNLQVIVFKVALALYVVMVALIFKLAGEHSMALGAAFLFTVAVGFAAIWLLKDARAYLRPGLWGGSSSKAYARRALAGDGNHGSHGVNGADGRAGVDGAPGDAAARGGVFSRTRFGSLVRNPSLSKAHHGAQQGGLMPAAVVTAAGGYATGQAVKGSKQAANLVRRKYRKAAEDPTTHQPGGKRGRISRGLEAIERASSPEERQRLAKARTREDKRTRTLAAAELDRLRHTEKENPGYLSRSEKGALKEARHLESSGEAPAYEALIASGLVGRLKERAADRMKTSTAYGLLTGSPESPRGAVRGGRKHGLSDADLFAGARRPGEDERHYTRRSVEAMRAAVASRARYDRGHSEGGGDGSNSEDATEEPRFGRRRAEGGRSDQASEEPGSGRGRPGSDHSEKATGQPGSGRSRAGWNNSEEGAEEPRFGRRPGDWGGASHDGRTGPWETRGPGPDTEARDDDPTAEQPTASRDARQETSRDTVRDTTSREVAPDPEAAPGPAETAPGRRRGAYDGARADGNERQSAREGAPPSAPEAPRPAAATGATEVPDAAAAPESTPTDTEDFQRLRRRSRGRNL